MSNSNRKCLASIPSSFASVYLITAFFAISFLSLLYLKYPQQYTSHFDYLRVIPKAKPESPPLSENDLTTPSVNLRKDVVVDTESNPTTTQALLSDSEFPPPSVVENPPSNLTTDVQEQKDDQLPTPAVVDSPVNDAISPSVALTETIDEEEKTRNNPEEQQMKASAPAAVTETASEKQETDDQGEEEDESAVPSVDHLSFPPTNSTKEERKEWIKQKLSESKILESTPKTRRFEENLLQFISTKRCRVNIFMTWISTTKFFGKRELFSLESALNAHPHGCVFIVSRIMTSQLGLEIIQPLIERGYKILAIAPDYPLLFGGTPAQDWLERLKTGQIDPGKIPITQNLSNLLRLTILFKYGGVYLDTDMIILKDVSGLTNTIGIQEVDKKRETWNSVNNAVLVFDKDHPLLYRFMEEFNSTFDGSVWGHNGPYMASRIIKKIVHDSRYQFNMVAPMAFYPVDWYNIYRFFRDPNKSNDTVWADDMFSKVSRESYGVHLWNKISRSLRIEKKSIIGRLISHHCIICQDVYGS